MFAHLDFWNDTCQRTPAEHMAMDEAMLRLARQPVLRTYRWASPAVTFGYGQRLRDAETFAGGRPVVRRWTGGGFVEHGLDLTLSIAVPAGCSCDVSVSAEVYARIHAAVAQALPSAETRLAGPDDVRPGPACFTSPAAGDVLEGAAKRCGGAMRRAGEGILYQGSIQGGALPTPDAVAQALAREMSVIDGSLFEAEAARLCTERYGSPAWAALR